MKLSLLSIVFFISCVICNAQIKVYEYPSQILTQDRIEKLIEQSKQRGTSEQELKKFRELLFAKMKRQPGEGVSASHKGPNPIVNSSACINPGFENGTNSNWNFYNGNILGINLPCDTCANIVGAVNNVVTATTTIPGQCTNGLDNYGGFPVVSPTGGTYALLLNDSTAGGKIMRANYSLNVDPVSNIFIFQYAAVLNYGMHAAMDAPYFHMNVTSNTTGSVIPCTDYFSNGTTGWSVSPILGGNAPDSIYYKNWTTIGVDLSFAIGQAVTISFEVSDCNAGGHFGYMYLDADCNGLNIVTQTTNLCNGNATLCGPPGYTNYVWTGPVTGSSQCLSTPSFGTYTLNMVSAISCPAPVYIYTVLPSANPVATYTLTQNAMPYTWDANPNYSSDVSNAVWYWGDGTNTNGMYPSHTYSAAGRYNICVTAFNSCGDSTQYCQNDSIYRISNGVASNMVYVNVVNNTTGLTQNLNVSHGLVVYPNPANNVVTLQSEEKLGTILIYNSLGEVILQTQSSTTTTEIDLSKLQAGIYTIKTQNKYLRLVKE